MNEKVIPLEDIVEVVKKGEVKADSTNEKQETEVVDSADEPKDEVKADEVAEVTEPKDEVKADEGEPKDSDIVGLEVQDEPKGEIEGELIDSEVREDEDKKRDEFMAEARDICDSADYGVSVKMPMLKGRHSYRSAVFSFARLNPQFVSKKYSNLRLDSYNNELCDEVKNDMFNNIRNSKPIVKNVVKGFVDTGKGYQVMENF